MTKKISFVFSILLTLTLLFTGCNDSSYVVKVGDTEIKPGLYLMMQINAYLNVAEKMNVGTEEFSKLSIGQQMKEISPLDQRNAKTWIQELTMQSVKSYVAIEKLYDKLGFKFTETDIALTKKDAEGTYASYEKFYKDNGIGIESVTLWLTNMYKTREVFKSIYYETGTKPVSPADQKKAYVENYAMFKYIATPYNEQNADGSYSDLSEDKITKLEAEAKEQVRRVNVDKVSLDVINAEIQVKAGATTDITALEPQFVEMDTVNLSGNLITAFKKLEVGQATYDKDANFKRFVTVQKMDVLADTAKFDEVKYNLIYKLKQTEFTQYLSDYLKDVVIDSPKSRINRYSPKNIKKLVSDTATSK